MNEGGRSTGSSFRGVAGLLQAGLLGVACLVRVADRAAFAAQRLDTRSLVLLARAFTLAAHQARPLLDAAKRQALTGGSLR